VDKIRVKINLLGDLEKYQKKPYFFINYGFTLSNVFQHLNIPKKKDLVIIVNGRRGDKDYILNDDDEITVFPTVDGG